MSSAKSPLVRPSRSPISSQMQNVEPSRIVSAIATSQSRTMRAPEDCASAVTTISSTFTFGGPRDREEDAVGHVLRADRSADRDVLVDRPRLLLVAAEANGRELGRPDEPRRDVRDPDRPAEQVLAQRAREARARRPSRSRRARRSGTRQMPAIEPMFTMWPPSRRWGRQSRVMRMRPWTFVSSTVSSSASVESSKGSRPRERPALLTRMSMPPSSATARADERRAALGIGHVERQREVGVDLLDAARPAGHARALGAQRADGRRRRSRLDAPRDDRGLPFRALTGGRA